jgi:hypothetical protein
MGWFTSLVFMTPGLVTGCENSDGASSTGSVGGTSNRGGDSSMTGGGAANSSISGDSSGNVAGADSTAIGGASNHGGAAGAQSLGGATSGQTGGAANPNEAGASGQSAGAGTSGTGVVPEVVLSGMSPMAITNDGVNLYWSTLFGSLDQRPIAGGATVPVASWASGSRVMPLVYTKSGLYLVANSKLERCSTTGECLVITDDINDFVVDDDEIFWLGNFGDVRRMPLDAASSELLLNDPSISTLGVYKNVVYYELSGDLYSLVPGSAPKKIGPVGDYSTQMAFDETSIYVLANSSAIVRVGYDGTGKKELMKAGNISNLVVDGGYLYFLAKHIGGCSTTDINRYDPSTGIIETLLAKFPCVMDYTIAGRDIYFTYFGLSDSAIYRLPLE